MLMNKRKPYSSSLIALLGLLMLAPGALAVEPAATILAGTEPLAVGAGNTGDWVTVIDAKIARDAATREQHWHRDFSSSANYERSVETNRARLD